MKQGDVMVVKCSGEPVVLSGGTNPEMAVVTRLNNVTGEYEKVEFFRYDLETVEERIAREYSEHVNMQKIIENLKDANKKASVSAN